MYPILAVVLSLFAVVNVLGVGQSIRKSPTVACGFALAALALIAAVLTRSTATLIAGLTLATLAPIGFGRYVLGLNHPLHHVVRAGLCVGILVAWLIG